MTTTPQLEAALTEAESVVRATFADSYHVSISNGALMELIAALKISVEKANELELAVNKHEKRNAKLELAACESIDMLNRAMR